MISIIFGSPSLQWIQNRSMHTTWVFLSFHCNLAFFQFRNIYLSWWHLEKSEKKKKKDFEEIFRWILNFTHIFLVFTPSLVSKATLLQEYSTLGMLSTQLSACWVLNSPISASPYLVLTVEFEMFLWLQQESKKRQSSKRGLDGSDLLEEWGHKEASLISLHFLHAR